MKLLEAPRVEVDIIEVGGCKELKLFGIVLREAREPFKIAGRHNFMPVKIKLEESDNIKIGEKCSEKLELTYGNYNFIFEGYFLTELNEDGMGELVYDYFNTTKQNTLTQL